MFEFVRCSKNDVRVRSMFDKMVFDTSLIVLTIPRHGTKVIYYYTVGKRAKWVLCKVIEMTATDIRDMFEYKCRCQYSAFLEGAARYYLMTAILTNMVSEQLFHSYMYYYIHSKACFLESLHRVRSPVHIHDILAQKMHSMKYLFFPSKLSNIKIILTYHSLKQKLGLSVLDNNFFEVFLKKAKFLRR